MIISDAHRFLFIHLIKTAGTSITAALKPFGKTHKEIGKGFGCHDDANELIERMGRQTFDSYFSFATVRNPWDLQVSLYHYILQNPKHHHHATVSAFKDFPEYLDWRCSQGIKTQRSALYSGDEQLVDYIGRYENVAADFEAICEKVGLQASLPRLNVSTSAPYQSFYTQEMVDKLAPLVEPDIQQFGYSFD